MGHRVLTTASAEEAVSLREGRDPALRNFVLLDVKVLKTRGDGQNFWCHVFMPGEWWAPPKNFAQDLIERAGGRLRALFGGQKQNPSSPA